MLLIIIGAVLLLVGIILMIITINSFYGSITGYKRYKKKRVAELRKIAIDATNESSTSSSMPVILDQKILDFIDRTASEESWKWNFTITYRIDRMIIVGIIVLVLLAIGICLVVLNSSH